MENAKHKMRNAAAPQTSRVTGGGALTADEGTTSAALRRLEKEPESIVNSVGGKGA